MSQTIKVTGQTIHYRESTGDGRPIVFVHGNSSSSSTWREVLESDLGQRSRCIALDLPGHASSDTMADPDDYTLSGHARVITEFADALGVEEAVFVGWSLGGHILLEAAPALRSAAGFAVFGTPPISPTTTLSRAFFPIRQFGFQRDLDADEALAYAQSLLAPGSRFPTGEFVADILRTQGVAREKIGESLFAGRFADEVAIVATLERPLAVIHGGEDQLVRLSYLRELAVPTLWRDTVQVIENTGHAPHREAPDTFRGLLEDFTRSLD